MKTALLFTLATLSLASCSSVKKSASSTKATTRELVRESAVLYTEKVDSQVLKVVQEAEKLTENANKSTQSVTLDLEPSDSAREISVAIDTLTVGTNFKIKVPKGTRKVEIKKTQTRAESASDKTKTSSEQTAKTQDLKAGSASLTYQGDTSLEQKASDKRKVKFSYWWIVLLVVTALVIRYRKRLIGFFIPLLLLGVWSCQKPPGAIPRPEGLILCERQILAAPGSDVLPALLRKPPRTAPAPTPAPQRPPTVVFIDADGHGTGSGTGWDYSAPINSGPAGLSQSALDWIQAAVSLDLDTLNVQVTQDSSVFLAAERGIRVVITVDYAWIGVTGGVAIRRSFMLYGKVSPVFVFSSCHNFNPQAIRWAVSHETAHALGLFHSIECTSGQLSNPYALAKVMGRPRPEPDGSLWAEWTVGLAGNCSHIQADLAEMAAQVDYK